MILADLPKGAKLMVRQLGRKEKEPATFHHLDGMYSLCTLATGEPFHLYHFEEMVKVGDHYELAAQQGEMKP